MYSRKFILAGALSASLLGACASPDGSYGDGGYYRGGSYNDSYEEDSRYGDSRYPRYCDNCGTVQSVQILEGAGEGDATGVGAIAGGVAGGLIGSQIGGGSGKTIATIAGAAGGAYAGHRAEQEYRSRNADAYRVVIKMNDGRVRTVSQPDDPRVYAGDYVQVVDGRVVKR